jgi:4-phospho-D-threonate 3-dehydrogenase / 4-phospho-D-erythronate 3-dehydrogenase
MKKYKIGITVGDINGIGLEVILKTLSNKKILDFCIPIIYGSSKIVSFHKNIVDNEIQFSPINNVSQAENGRINVLNIWQDTVQITMGELNENGGKYALLSIQAAVKDLKNGVIDGIVTAPIHKKAMEMAGFKHTGHTEYLTEEFGAKESLMLMVSEDLRIGLVTNHLPLGEVAKAITKEKIIEKVKIFSKTLIEDFGIEKPLIAVLGLNPHAGDGGVIGKEELSIIRPAVEACKALGINTYGPYPADGFFGSENFKKFDGILAMYHDQGLIPFKSLVFGQGINYTAGLNFVRTSPDHGTGFDIAGTNQANATSFRQALFLAIDVIRNRKTFAENHENPINRTSQKLKSSADDYSE